MNSPILIRRARLAGTPQRSSGLWDVRVREGSIVSLGQSMSPGIDEVVVDAEGKLLSPGLIDIHAHVGPTSLLGLTADRIGICQGVTTVIDAGSSGPGNFNRFAKSAIDTQETRVLAWINFSRYGLEGDLSELDSIQKLSSEDELRAAFTDPRIVGMKLRASGSVVGPLGLTPIRLGVEMARRLGIGVMVHVGNAPPVLGDVLNLLSTGDIVTHAFHGKRGGILGSAGKVIPEALAARQRGVLFDVGHGNASFNVDVMKRCLDQGFGPDTVSSDLHSKSIYPVVSLPLTISKFAALGFGFPEAIEFATSRVEERLKIGLGVLAEGYAADLVLWDIVDGDYACRDSEGNPMNIERVLTPVWVMKGGTMARGNRED